MAYGPPLTVIVTCCVTGAVISWKSKLTVSVTVPGLLGLKSVSDNIVVPGGTSPTFTTFPTTSRVEDTTAKLAKSVSASIVVPWAVAFVGFLIVKLIVKVEFRLTEDG